MSDSEITSPSGFPIRPADRPGDDPVDWFSWPTVTYVKSSGCFAYQIDGTTFTEVIVFRARAR